VNVSRFIFDSNKCSKPTFIRIKITSLRQQKSQTQFGIEHIQLHPQ